MKGKKRYRVYSHSPGGYFIYDKRERETLRNSFHETLESARQEAKKLNDKEAPSDPVS